MKESNAMGRLALTLIAVLALSACEAEDDAQVLDPVEEAGDDAATESDEDEGDQGPVEDVAIEVDNELFAFDYSYPKEAVAIAPLRRHLASEAKSARERLEREAREARDEAREEGFPYNAFASGTQWQVVADTPRFLSLSAKRYSYTGGAHPNYGSNALVWDREAGRLLEPLDFFTSAKALTEAIEPRYCEALAAERRKRRGEEEAQAASGSFDACPDVSELTVLLGSSDKKRFDRIGFIADPYVVGPYAEGAYEITLKVDQALLGAVRPAFREAFAAR